MNKSLLKDFSRWIDISKINEQPIEKTFYFIFMAIKPDFYSKDNLQKYFMRLKGSSIIIDEILGSLILFHKESSLSKVDIDLLKDPNVKFVYFEKKCIYDNIGPEGKMLYTPVFYFENEILNILSSIDYGECRNCQTIYEK